MIGVSHNVTDANNDCHALTGNEAGQATLPNNTVQPLLTPAALCIIPATYCLCIATEVLSELKDAYLHHSSTVQHEKHVARGYQSTHIQHKVPHPVTKLDSFMTKLSALLPDMKLTL